MLHSNSVFQQGVLQCHIGIALMILFSTWYFDVYHVPKEALCELQCIVPIVTLFLGHIYSSTCPIIADSLGAPCLYSHKVSKEQFTWLNLESSSAGCFLALDVSIKDLTNEDVVDGVVTIIESCISVG